jgi:hypothetical protein
MLTGDLRAGFRWENLRERDHLGNVVVDGRVILKLILER